MTFSALAYLFCVAAYFLFLVFFLLRKNGLASLVLNPALLSISFIVMIHAAIPALQEIDHYYRYQGSYPMQIHLQSIGFVAVGALAYLFGLRVIYWPRLNRLKLGTLSKKGVQSYLLVATLVGLIAAYYSFQNIRLILSVGIDNYLSDRISLGFGRGLSVLLSHWTYMSVLLFFIGYQIVPRRTLGSLYCLVMLFVSVPYTFFYYSLNSNRNSAFILMLNLIGFWVLFRPRLWRPMTSKELFSAMKLVSFVLVIAVALFYIGKFRRRDSAFGYSVTESLNGAFGNHENMLWLLSHDFETQNGMTFVAGLANLVPRSIWPEKPFGGGPVLKNMIYPGSYVIGEEKNSSLTTGLFTEILMNTGKIYFVPACFLFGVMIGTLLRCLAHYDSFCFIVVFVSVSLSTQLFYGEFLGFFTRLFVSLVPLVLAALLAKPPVYRVEP